MIESSMGHATPNMEFGEMLIDVKMLGCQQGVHRYLVGSRTNARSGFGSCSSAGFMMDVGSCSIPDGQRCSQC